MKIHRAIKQGQLDIVEQLIGDNPSALHICTPFGTWLQDAASCGQISILRWLVNKGLDVNFFNDSNEYPPLCKACAKGHFEVVKTLIDLGAAMDVSDSIRNPLFTTIVGTFDYTPSHTAIARFLVGCGIDIKVRYSNLGNMDALEFAREWGRKDIADFLETQLRAC
ncbi:MAG: ankyrin repeat domain-containing protein [Zavarzinella sp.]